MPVLLSHGKQEPEEAGTHLKLTTSLENTCPRRRTLKRSQENSQTDLELKRSPGLCKALSATARIECEGLEGVSTVLVNLEALRGDSGFRGALWALGTRWLLIEEGSLNVQASSSCSYSARVPIALAAFLCAGLSIYGL